MSDIDPKKLTTVYKKNGSFDKQRKMLLENFRQLETHANLLLKLKVMVEHKIKNDPSILLKNKGKMGALIQGEIINEHLNKGSGPGASLLSIVDKDIQDKIIDSPEFHAALQSELSDVNRVLLGISDEDYEKQLAERELAKQQAKERAVHQERDDVRHDAEPEYTNAPLRNKPGMGHRVSKPPRFNFASYRRKDDDKEPEEKKSFLRY